MSTENTPQSETQESTPSMPIDIFLDDCRETPEGWVRAYWPAEVTALFATHSVRAVSLDHDLGDSEAARAENRREITGDDVVTWIMEQVVCHNMTPPALSVHSDNGPGIMKMRLGIEAIYRHYHAQQNAQRSRVR